MSFLQDKEGSSRFDHVKCSKIQLGKLTGRAKHMEGEAGGKYFLSRFIGLVFSKEELAAANGLGLRGENGLDNTKVDAITGM